ncbi:MAG: altronate dehydratase family protein [Clostridia bacterium]|nr:altronate dehydratase family protein [Clostridia bacterium]
MNGKSKILKIHDKDNVAVALADIRKGENIEFEDAVITAFEDIDKGHKVAFKDIPSGEDVVKYGFPIGHATRSISAGEYVHTHNIKTNLEGILDYSYNPGLSNFEGEKPSRTFKGYVRADGKVGIRNEIWIVNTVGCVNKTSELLAKQANLRFDGNTDGIFAFPHPYGCSQMGDDQVNTQKILAGMVHHPNAAGVLVLGLGCENNNIPEFKKVLGEYDPKRVKFLVTQEVEDEIEEGLKLIEELIEYASTQKRQDCPLSKLIVGLKCGGSDAFSGITANPLVGTLSDLLIEQGGTSILTEVPEMFGAETILMNRCINGEIFNKAVELINGFKEYYIKHDQVIYDNPSPGNKKGGISTLEEKSLGCTQKGGVGNVVDVLDYGEPVKAPGLNLLRGPGNDIVAVTALMASGAHLILFTTGRGTPLGAPVPTIKISTNTDLAERKKAWIDFDAGQILDGKDISRLKFDFLEFVSKTASGEIKAKNEINGYREIAIFKDGVTL